MLRDEVTAELNKLVETEVIEPIDGSEWNSPLVVAR